MADSRELFHFYANLNAVAILGETNWNYEITNLKH